MYKNEMHLNFLSISQNEAFARTAVAAFAAQLNPTIEELADIRTSVSEAVTNAIIHGYENDPNGIVYIDCRIEGPMLEMEIRDSGKGIEDVSLAMQPFYTSMPGLERSGMGFSVMEAFMDSVSVHSVLDKGTRVTMRKSIKQVEAE